ncbi:hypothetical protein scyTo_0005158 [Scyliorhinus torazame]|uniref:IMD domain-containing protein n=1 Tax=Scyliorhinus torazame TaxID=75743 RepID=A0A401P385_SCYTO|nr:hypothetical protein [Scyliorhinus torazame]
MDRNMQLDVEYITEKIYNLESNMEVFLKNSYRQALAEERRRYRFLAEKHFHLTYQFLSFYSKVLSGADSQPELFPRGTNPFATVKLKPTVTNDRSKPFVRISDSSLGDSSRQLRVLAISVRHHVKPLAMESTDYFIVSSDLHIVDGECYNAFGNIWGLYLGRQAFLVLTDTEIIHKVFIEDRCEIFASAKTHQSQNPFSESFFQSDDQDWKRLHQLLMPAFSSTQLRQTFPLVATEADDLIRHFGTVCREGRPVTVRELFAQYARNVLTMSLFDLDIRKDNASRTFIHYWDLLLQAHTRYSTISVTLMFPALMPLIRKIKFHLFWKEAIGYFTGLVHHARERRRDYMEAQKCASFLQYLLDHEEIRTNKRKKPLQASGKFTRQERDAREPECFLPFGLGALSCIGSEFNVMMIKVALASILKCYRFTLCSLTPMYLDIETLGATRSKIPIILQVDLL